MTNHPHAGHPGFELPRETWIDRAKCVGMDPGLFSPVRRRNGDTRNFDQIARDLCHGCPVKPECAIDSLNNSPADIHIVRAGVYLDDNRAKSRQRLLPIAKEHPQWPTSE